MKWEKGEEKNGKNKKAILFSAFADLIKIIREIFRVECCVESVMYTERVRGVHCGVEEWKKMKKGRKRIRIRNLVELSRLRMMVVGDGGWRGTERKTERSE